MRERKEKKKEKKFTGQNNAIKQIRRGQWFALRALTEAYHSTEGWRVEGMGGGGGGREEREGWGGGGVDRQDRADEGRGVGAEFKATWCGLLYWTQKSELIFQTLFFKPSPTSSDYGTSTGTWT